MAGGVGSRFWPISRSDKPKQFLDILDTGKTFLGPVILATGHSARDVYRYLIAQHIAVEAKGIAVGVRLEHPQQLIDRIRYHNPNGRGEYLPAAEYSLEAWTRGGFQFPALWPHGCRR